MSRRPSTAAEERALVAAFRELRGKYGDNESLVVTWRRLIVGTKDRPSGLTWKARWVAIALSLHMDANGGSCFPSVRTLEREAAIARSTVCAALDELERGGYIRRDRGGPNRSTRYRAAVGGSPIAGLGVVRHANHLVRVADYGGSPGGPEDVHKGRPEDLSRARKKPARPKEGQARRSRGGAHQNQDHDFSELDEATVVDVDDYASGRRP